MKCLAISALVLLLLPAAYGQDGGADGGIASAQPLPEDGPSYPVGRFSIRFQVRDHPGLPSRGTMSRLEIELGRTPSGYVAPRPGVETVTIRPRDVEDGPVERYYASAIQVILRRMYDELASRDLIGVFVAPDPKEIDVNGVDLREPDSTRFRILITTGIVAEAHTIASGERFEEAEAADNPAHARIIDQSPVRPSREGDVERLDLLRGEALDSYLEWLSRHPGRRVDAAVSPGDETGNVNLEFHVDERRPFALYAELSNTGTASTDRLRERVGLVHNQLTGRDDILSIDFTTAAFDEVNAAVASYEAPSPFGERTRWRVFGQWSEYTASEVGVFADVFTGESWAVGGEIIANIYQDGPLFADLAGGLRVEEIAVENQAVGISGEERFEFLHLGVRVGRLTALSSLAASVDAEWNDLQSPAPDEGEMNRLGRLFPDPRFGVVRWNLRGAAYLEPLFDREAWDDPSTPATSTLAHEVVVGFRGQYAFDNRLVPQYQQTLGGMLSVRGYPESVVAGDTVMLGTLEYRYHVPRAFSVRPTPGELFGEPFRSAPQHVYGRPDWDLVLKAFTDIGRSTINDALFFERDETLLGAGVGVELQFRRSLNLRVDWGFALQALDDRDVSSGSNRVHFVASVFF